MAVQSPPSRWARSEQIRLALPRLFLPTFTFLRLAIKHAQVVDFDSFIWLHMVKSVMYSDSETVDVHTLVCSNKPRSHKKPIFFREVHWIEPSFELDPLEHYQRSTTTFEALHYSQSGSHNRTQDPSTLALVPKRIAC